MLNRSVGLAAGLILVAHGVSWAQAPAMPSVKPPNAASSRAALAGAALVSFTGDVSVLRAGAAAPQRIGSAPASLRAGDKVISAADATAVLRLADSSEIRLGPGAEFMVAVDKPGLMSLFLWSGKIWADVVANRKRRFEIRTVAAVAAVRGTRFSVEMLDAKTTATEVYEGAVAVDGLKGVRPLGSPALVLPGQRVEVVRGAGPGPVRAIVAPRKHNASLDTPSTREQLAEQLGVVLARALAERQADTEAAVEEALSSGDAARMSRLLAALGGSSGLDADEKAAVGEAFVEGRSLSKVELLAIAALPAPKEPAAVAAPAEKRQTAAALKWALGREVGLQSDSQFRTFALAQAASGSTTFGTGARVMTASLQQPYAQAYFDVQSTLGGGAGLPSTGLVCSAGAGSLSLTSSLQTNLQYSGTSPLNSATPLLPPILPPLLQNPQQPVLSCTTTCLPIIGCTTICL